MATNWTYIPLIGAPISIKNGADTVIPRASATGYDAAPRANRLKTYLKLLNADPTDESGDATIDISVQGLAVASAAAITNTDGSVGLNGLVPVVTLIPARAASALGGLLYQNVTFAEDTDTVEVEISFANSTPAPSDFYVCIDFSHSVTN